VQSISFWPPRKKSARVIVNAPLRPQLPAAQPGWAAVATWG